MVRSVRVWVAVLAMVVGSALWGQRLPIKSFSASDGLPGAGISQIKRDAHGFLWFCSPEGAVRFDGYAFVRFGAETGLPAQGIHDLLQTRDGCFWFATDKELFRLDPSLPADRPATERIKVISSTEGLSAVFRLLEDRSGVLWCGTPVGLFRVDRGPGKLTLQSVDLGLPRKRWDDPIVSALAEKLDGGLWVGTGSGLCTLSPEGRVQRYTHAEALPCTQIRSLAVEEDGSLWMATPEGIAKLRLTAGGSHLGIVERYAAANGLGSPDVQTLLLASNGTLFAGTNAGLSVLDHGTLRKKDGLPKLFSSLPTAFAEDHSGNIWVAFNGAGLARFRQGRFELFTQEQGVPEGWIRSLMVDTAGRLWLACSVGGDRPIRPDAAAGAPLLRGPGTGARDT